MYLEEEDLCNNIWSLRGNKKEFIALYTLISIADFVGIGLKRTEKKVIKAIKTQIKNEILETEKEETKC